MTCSLCGMGTSKGMARCILCEKAFAAGRVAERERCAVLAKAAKGNLRVVNVVLTGLAMDILNP
jgi:hypothetical protein